MGAAGSQSSSGGAIVRLVAWLLALTTAIAGLTALGSETLAVPPLTDPGAWGSWLRTHDPLVAAFGVLRLVALATAWYLLGGTIVGAVARGVRWSRLVAVADLLTVPALRRLLQASLGVGLATAATLTAGGQDPVPEPVAPTVASLQLIADDDEERATMVPLDSDGVPGFLEMLDDDTGDDARPDNDVTWTVRRGEHFWSIAEEVLERAWGRAPSDAEIDPYWRRLVEANRRSLPDPGNPDLLLPKMRLTVPDPPEEPSR